MCYDPSAVIRMNSRVWTGPGSMNSGRSGAPLIFGEAGTLSGTTYSPDRDLFTVWTAERR